MRRLFILLACALVLAALAFRYGDLARSLIRRPAARFELQLDEAPAGTAPPWSEPAIALRAGSAVAGTLRARQVAVRVDASGCDLVLPREQVPATTAYLVLATGDNAARVHAWAFGRAWSTDLAPCDVAVVPLQWPERWPASLRKPVIRLRAPRGSDHACIAHVAPTRGDAVRLCTEYGRPDRAFDLPASGGTGETSLHDFLAAVESGRTNESARAAAEASSLLNPAGDAAPPPSIALALPDAVRASVSEEAAATSIDLPCFLPPGRYTVTGFLQTVGTHGAFEIRDRSGKAVLASAEGAHTSPLPFSLTFQTTVAAPPSLRIAGAPACVELSGLHVRADGAEAAAALRSRVVDALAQAALARGEPERAMAWLDADPNTAWNEAVRRALRFRAAWASPELDYEGLRAAAKHVLELAPAHFAAIELLRHTTRAPLYATRHRETGAIEPLAFAPFASLVNAAATNGHLRSVLEVERSDLPALHFVLVRRQRGTWREIAARPVGTHRPYHEGERIVVDLPLPRSYPLNRLGVGLAVRRGARLDWLPPAGAGDTCVAIPRLLAREAGELPVLQGD